MVGLLRAGRLSDNDFHSPMLAYAFIFKQKGRWLLDNTKHRRFIGMFCAVIIRCQGSFTTYRETALITQVGGGGCGSIPCPPDEHPTNDHFHFHLGLGTRPVQVHATVYPFPGAPSLSLNLNAHWRRI